MSFFYVKIISLAIFQKKMHRVIYFCDKMSYNLKIMKFLIFRDFLKFFSFFLISLNLF